MALAELAMALLAAAPIAALTEVALGRTCAGSPRRLLSLEGAGAGQASTQAPSRRVSPCRSRVRRLIAAHRVCSQASFLAVPM